ncbi:MAG: hypothetical protein JRE18_00715 [Deltaproteobacteria bacterium]|jgi:hypothetical protein|nr:hypothetical protein [Deltaproteobacteria bacterium]
MKKILVIFAIILVPTVAFANFSIQLDNNTGKKMYYALYWVDHVYDWPYPFNLAGGELKASESIDLRSSYRTGKYYVVWSDSNDWENRVMIDVDDDVRSVIVTPIKSSMKK